MNWDLIFSADFQSKFNQVWNEWIHLLLGVTGWALDQPLGLLPFVFFSLAIMIVARIVVMIRRIADDGPRVDGDRSVPRGGWRNE